MFHCAKVLPVSIFTHPKLYRINNLVRRLLLHFITIIVASLTFGRLKITVERNDEVTKEWIVTKRINDNAKSHRPIAPIITRLQTFTKACVYLETACPTERTGHLAKGENLIPVNCHANVIRVHNIYIIHRVS